MTEVNKLIEAIDDYLKEINIANNYLWDTRKALYFIGYMTRVIDNFLRRTFHDYEKRSKDFKHLLNICSGWEKEKNQVKIYLGSLEAMTITLSTIREELRVFGLESKKINLPQKETLTKKIEETKKKSLELGFDKLLPTIKYKTEKEEKETNS
jgi:transposase